MVRELIRALAFRRHVDQSAEGIGKATKALWTMNRVEIEDDAGVGLLGPRQEAFVVARDETDCAVNQIDLVGAEVGAHFVEELLPRYVDLGDDFGCRVGGMELRIDFRVIVIRVEA
ncbi:MAG: hypothetical protein WB762_17745 [Candidatus Sulfotelmatobacter sp.]